VMKNQCDKDVIVYWADFEGQLAHPRTMKLNATVHQRTGFGCRYEAYIDGKLIATYNVAPGPGGRAYVVWEIKRK